LLFYLNGHHLIDAKYAKKVLETHSLFGLTPVLAAFTGILLWLSSIAAGWIGNWFVYRELNVALAQHRGLRRIFGRIRMERTAKYLEGEVAGVSGNVVLGFLLGMTPKIFAFFGILLDVRHVTLSTGMVALAAYVMGAALTWKLGLFAVGGLIAAGIMNLSFSFGLALMVANRSQRLTARQVRMLYRHVVVALVKKPKALFFPQ
jgi:site-specific recombinase